jgi:hypothetical protein
MRLSYQRISLAANFTAEGFNEIRWDGSTLMAALGIDYSSSRPRKLGRHEELKTHFLVLQCYEPLRQKRRKALSTERLED